MGQLYSFLGYSSATENNNQVSVLASYFCCKICLEILHDPVQCRNNEHYFCRKCITRHLMENSETCALCMDNLTLKTLRPPTQIVASVISQMKKPTNEERIATNKYGQIFIFGGDYRNDATGKSAEVFDWLAKTWTLIENCLFFNRSCSFSFIYGKKVMVCGGDDTGRIEYLIPSERGNYASVVASVSLPSNAQCNGVLYDNTILTFGSGVVETSLQSPGESKTLMDEKKDRNCSAGVHCFCSSIYIVGGHESSLEKYDVSKNELQSLATVPYKVSDMATVAYKDNIIILGGQNGDFGDQPLNDAVMFNITSQEYKKLPSMLEKRSGCTAVIMGDVIVVMGGKTKSEASESKWTMLNTVEYYVIGDNAWKELPAMNLAREDATACVYV